MKPIATYHRWQVNQPELGSRFDICTRMGALVA